MRILFCIGNLFLFFCGRFASIAGKRFHLFDIGGLAGMFLVLVISSIRHTIQLYREERIA